MLHGPPDLKAQKEIISMRTLLYLVSLLVLLVAGCQTKPKDYTEYRKHYPKSILVLPPINNTTEILAGYSVLSTATRPVAEMGYYVFPVVVVDQFMKENGLPGPNEMHGAPLNKLRDIFGADAVLYITVEQYGTKYQVISSTTTILLKAKLMDTQTGICLWENTSVAQAGNSGIIEAVVGQIASKLADQAHGLAASASIMLVSGPDGLLHGARHPNYVKDSQAK
jgi:hypothetical protein